MEYEKKGAIHHMRQTSSEMDSKTDAVPAVDPMKLRRFMQEIRDNQNLSMALVGGLAAAALGATVWAAITALTGLQIGWLAVGVGYLVGITVRKLGAGIDKTFGALGAGCALLGCLAGNLLTICVFISIAENISLTEVVSRLDWDIATSLMIDSFDPIDALFYGIAVYYGYKNSFRQTTPEEMRKLARIS